MQVAGGIPLEAGEFGLAIVHHLLRRGAVEKDPREQARACGGDVHAGIRGEGFGSQEFERAPWIRLGPVEKGPGHPVTVQVPRSAPVPRHSCVLPVEFAPVLLLVGQHHARQGTPETADAVRGPGFHESPQLHRASREQIEQHVLVGIHHPLFPAAPGGQNVAKLPAPVEPQEQFRTQQPVAGWRGLGGEGAVHALEGGPPGALARRRRRPHPHVRRPVAGDGDHLRRSVDPLREGIEQCRALGGAARLGHALRLVELLEEFPPPPRPLLGAQSSPLLRTNRHAVARVETNLSRPLQTDSHDPPLHPQVRLAAHRSKGEKGVPTRRRGKPRHRSREGGTLARSDDRSRQTDQDLPWSGEVVEGAQSKIQLIRHRMTEGPDHSYVPRMQVSTELLSTLREEDQTGGVARAVGQAERESRFRPAPVGIERKQHPWTQGSTFHVRETAHPSVPQGYCREGLERQQHGASEPQPRVLPGHRPARGGRIGRDP